MSSSNLFHKNGGLPYIIGNYGEFHKSTDCICHKEPFDIYDNKNNSNFSRLCFCENKI